MNASLNSILLKHAIDNSCISVLLISGGGFHHGAPFQELHHFEYEQSLMEWINDEFIKQHNNCFEHEWINENTEGDIYSITSWTDKNPGEGGWDVHQEIIVYYPGSSSHPIDEREPARTFNKNKNNNSGIGLICGL